MSIKPVDLGDLVEKTLASFPKTQWEKIAEEIALWNKAFPRPAHTYTAYVPEHFTKADIRAARARLKRIFPGIKFRWDGSFKAFVSEPMELTVRQALEWSRDELDELLEQQQMDD